MLNLLDQHAAAYVDALSESLAERALLEPTTVACWHDNGTRCVRVRAAADCADVESLHVHVRT